MIADEENNTHGVEYYGLQHDTPVDHGTMHLSVADRFGGAVSITSTVSSNTLLVLKFR